MLVQVPKAGEPLKEPVCPVTASVRGNQRDPWTGGHLETVSAHHLRGLQMEVIITMWLFLGTESDLSSQDEQM